MYNRPFRAAAAKVSNFMKKLLIPFLLSCVLVAPACSTVADEPEDTPSYISTTIRASAFFSEVGSIKQLNEVYVGKTYSVHFSPYSTPLDSYKDYINGSVEKVTYSLDVPYKGVLNIGSASSAPFTIQYTPTEVGLCILTASFDLSPNDHNNWIEVESFVNVLTAE